MIERLVALDVADNDGYQAYRDAMSPLLKRMGGGLSYDFTIANTLKSGAKHPINRVFVIFFPDWEARDRFFGDESYREIKKRLFETSVKGATIIGEYEVAPKRTRD